MLKETVEKVGAKVADEDENAEEELPREYIEEDTPVDTDEELEIVEETVLDVCEAAGKCGKPGLVNAGSEKLGYEKAGCTAALELESRLLNTTEDVKFSSA